MPLEDDIGLLEKKPTQKGSPIGLVERVIGPARRFVQGGLEETPGFFRRFVAPAVLPTAGQIVGGTLGGLATAPTIGGVPGGILAGESAGGGFGEVLNQLLGVTKPSVAQIGFAAAGGPMGRAIGAGLGPVFRFIGKRLPGAPIVLQEEAVGAARGIAEKLPLPEVASSELFSRLENLNPVIPMKNFKAAALRLFEREELTPGLQSSNVKTAAKGILEAVGEGDEIPFHQASAFLKRIGERTGTVEGQEATETRGAFKLLTRAIHDDLDEAVKAGGQASETVGLLRQARAAYRRESSIQDLSDIIERSITPPKRGDIAEVANAPQIMKALKADSFLTESFSKAEMADIGKLLNGIKGLPPLPPPRGAMFGAGVMLGRGSFTGGLTQYLSGDPSLSASVGLMAAGAPRIIGELLSTSGGRSVLRNLIRVKAGVLDHQAFAIMGQYLNRATLSEPVE